MDQQAHDRKRRTEEELRTRLNGLDKVPICESFQLSDEIAGTNHSASKDGRETVDRLRARARDCIPECATEPLGEYVLVLGGTPERDPATEPDVAEALRSRLAVGMAKPDAVAKVAAELSVPKRQAYAAALRLLDPTFLDSFVTRIELANDVEV